MQKGLKSFKVLSNVDKAEKTENIDVQSIARNVLFASIYCSFSGSL